MTGSQGNEQLITSHRVTRRKVNRCLENTIKICCSGTALIRKTTNLNRRKNTCSLFCRPHIRAITPSNTPLIRWEEQDWISSSFSRPLQLAFFSYLRPQEREIEACRLKSTHEEKEKERCSGS